MLVVTFLFLSVLFLAGSGSTVNGRVFRIAICFLIALGAWPKRAAISVVLTPSCSQAMTLAFSSGEISFFPPHHLLVTKKRRNWWSENMVQLWALLADAIFDRISWYRCCLLMTSFQESLSKTTYRNVVCAQRYTAAKIVTFWR
jgi:hypothetical protein